METSLSANIIKVLDFAKEEAAQLGSLTVEPNHLLLGLVRLADDAGADLLRRRGLTLIPVMNEVRKSNSDSMDSDSVRSASPLLSPVSLYVLAQATEIGQSSGAAECKTAHLVFALVDHVPTKLLIERLGADPYAIGAEARQIINPPLGYEQAQSLDVVNVLKTRIHSWSNRAQMARKQGNDELARQAEERVTYYQGLLDLAEQG